MFNAKPRPVPSKAALRVLYQLAYISSGTAVGIGTLCAEERRRRTKYVQQVADNAKRIRQSPRYHSNASLAVSEAAEEFFNPNSETRDDTRRLDADSYIRRRVVKSPEMPSVVEKGYKQKHVDRRRSRKSLRDAEEKTGPHLKELNAERNSHNDPATTASAKLTQRLPIKKADVGRLPGIVRQDPTMRPFTQDDTISSLQRDPGGTTSVRLQKSFVKKNVLLRNCRSRLLSGHARTAAEELVVYCDQYATRLHKSVPDLIDETLTATLSQSLFTAHVELLRRACSILDETKAIDHFESFLRVCDKQEMYGEVWDLAFGDKSIGRKLLDKLNGRSYQILAIACSNRETNQRESSRKVKEKFEFSYRRTPAELRPRLVQSRTCLKLKALWKSTRNLKEVQAEFQQQLSWLEKWDENNALAKPKLITAFVEILVSANDVPLAMTTLADLCKTHTTTNDMSSLAALMCAKRGAWDSVKAALDVVAQSGLQVEHNFTTRLNQILHLHVQAHGIGENWEFVKYLVDTHGFMPNTATTYIMLQSCVIGNQIPHIQKWLQYVEELGLKTTVDARLAADLVKVYYEKYRPSHVLVMWFCRNLVNAVPSLAKSEFSRLVKHAIGYDLRNLKENDAAWKRTAALARLQRTLEADGDSTPSPGHRWNNQVYFKDESLTGKDSRDLGQYLRCDYKVADFKAFNFLRDPTGEHLESEMALALSMKQNEKVIELYHLGRDAVGLPSSPLALELAVLATIRKHHGDTTDAEALLTNARDSGMNIACAMGPVLMGQIARLRTATRKDTEKLRDMVIEYYRMNQENGLPLKNHLGVTAARALIRKGRAKAGLVIMKNIYKLNENARNVLDIPAMHVFLQGFAAMNHLHGIQWVIRTVLREDIRIDRGFARGLMDVRRLLRKKSTLSSHYNERGGAYYGAFSLQTWVARLGSWHKQILERRQQQMQMSKRLGQRLVLTLMKVAKDKQPTRRSHSTYRKFRLGAVRQPYKTASTRPLFRKGHVAGGRLPCSAPREPRSGEACTHAAPDSASAPAKQDLADDISTSLSSGELADERRTAPTYQPIIPSTQSRKENTSRPEYSARQTSYWHSSEQTIKPASSVHVY